MGGIYKKRRHDPAHHHPPGHRRYDRRLSGPIQGKGSPYRTPARLHGRIRTGDTPATADPHTQERKDFKSERQTIT